MQTLRSRNLHLVWAGGGARQRPAVSALEHQSRNPAITPVLA